jgi:hypothetical protein
MQDFVYLIEAHYGVFDMACDNQIGCCLSLDEAETLVRNLAAYAEWHRDAERPFVAVSDDADFETIVAAEEEEHALWELQAKAKMYQLDLMQLESVIDLFSVVEYNPDVEFSFKELSVFPKALFKTEVSPGAVA